LIVESMPAPTRQDGTDSTSESSTRKSGRSLAQAVVTALVLLGIVALCYALGRSAFFVLIAVVVTIALYELLDAVGRSNRRPVVPFGLVCGLAMMIVAYARRPALVAVVLAVALFGALVFALRSGRGSSPATDAAWTFLGIAWVGGGGAAATAIMMLNPGGLPLLVATVLISALDDIGAFFAGSNLGRHKLAPSISPAKSWEGAVAGFVTALIGGLVAGALLDEITFVEGLGLGAVCGLFSPPGDLIESLVKRELGIKDSGRLLPGHGGFLDRLDAIMFCTPPAYLYLRFVVF
jgi:phosphatidate cytidylyltransferase